MDRLAKRLPLLGVLDGVLERRPADADRVRRQLDAGAVEPAHHPVETLTLLTHPAILGEEAVVEEELAGGIAAAAHLGQLAADVEALVALLEDEGGDAP